MSNIEFLTAEVLEAHRNIYGEPQDFGNAEDLIDNGEPAVLENQD